MSRRLPWKRVTTSTMESNKGFRMASNTLMQWSTCANYLAVASITAEEQGQVEFITSSGAKNDTIVSRSCRVTSLQWHLTEPTVAVGWTDGNITVNCLRENSQAVTIPLPQEAAIFHVEWSHNGKVLCVVDKTGHVHLYSYNSRSGDLVHVGDYDLHEKPTAVRKMFFRHKTLLFKTNLIFGRQTVIEEPSELNGVEETNGIEDEELKMANLDKALKERKRRMGTRRMSAFGPPSGTAFLVATDRNTLYTISDQGIKDEIFTFDQYVVYLDYYDEKNLLMVMTSDQFLHQLEMQNENWSERWKVKLGGKDMDIYRFLLLDGLFMTAFRSKDIRVWDLAAEESTSMALTEAKGFTEDEICLSVAYSRRKGTITAGTNMGRVANWRKRQGEKRMDTTWRLQMANQIGEEEVQDVSWSPLHPVLAVNTGSGITILRDEHNIVSMKNKIAVIQSGPTSFTLLNVATGVNQELKLAGPPLGVHIVDKQLVVWTKDTVLTFDVQTSLATIQSTAFACAATDVIINQQTLYCIEKDKINARTLQGTVRQVITLPEMEGDPVLLSQNRNWLAVATTNGFVRIYDVSKKEARQEHHSKYIVEAVESFWKWASVRINIAGSRVACTFYKAENVMSEKVVVFDAETDTVSFFSFDKGMTDQQEYEAEAELAAITSQRPVTAAARKMEREQSRYRMMLHRPSAIHWDEADERFLVCEAISHTAEVLENMVLSMFVTAENGIQLHDLIKVSPACEKLIGVAVPQMFFLKRSEFDDEEIRGEKAIGRLVIGRTLREFAGLEQCDENTRKAMMDFSLYLSLGQMDDAFKAIKFIKSDSVWEQMASMAVKTRRLDVVQVCLGHMKNIRGARALRQAQLDGENSELQCAAVAVQLGMIDEAEAIYATHDRYDKVNHIEQAQGQWQQSFDIAARYDRIHLRNTCYNFAKFCEELGAIDDAIANYEKSETHQFEVLRMLSNAPRLLDNYIRSKRDPEIQKFWARYLESSGEYEGASNFYLIANDILSFVRVKSMQGKVDEAAKKALETGDQAACYHMAKVYEAEKDYEKAVNFYTKARAFSSAIRIAKEQDLKDKLANLCLLSGGNDMVDAARYYENIPGYAHQAVMLYHKAGMIGRALDLAFRTEQFSALDLVVKDLDATSEPTTLKRAAEFFESNQNYEKAVELLCMAKAFSDAISLCKRKNVRISDQMAELLTPNKETTPSVAERKELLFAVAELCIQQGVYILAAKKYTQAGDKIKAMRALLRSGDTQKIRFFANTARSKEIYILAANYLQSTDWKGEVEIVRDIETFYSKAQSPEHLSNFYISCAHMEVENYNDFDKAQSALEQAQLCLENAMKKTPENTALSEIQRQVQAHLKQLQEFQKIKGVYGKDPNDAVRQLQTLAEAAEQDDVIKPCHIFALLIAHHGGKENWTQAYRCIQQLKKQMPNCNLPDLVDPVLLDKICDEMRVDRITSTQPTGAESDDDNEEVDFSHAMKRRQAVP